LQRIAQALPRVVKRPGDRNRMVELVHVVAGALNCRPEWFGIVRQGTRIFASKSSLEEIRAYGL
jgi:hypothetical protein